MIEFGKTLRDAREGKGLTISQIADSTRMAPSTVRDLEMENFSRITAPIYGRGFVKLYCEAVGLDPKPLVAEFMEIYSGNREPTILERKTEPDVSAQPAPTADTFSAPEPPVAESVAPVVAPVTTPEPPPSGPAIVQPSLGDLAPEEKLPLPERPAVRSQSLPDFGEPLRDMEQEQAEPKASRYATPVRHIQRAATASPILRIALLAVIAVGLVLAAVIGIGALYRATSAPAAAKQTPAEEPRTEQPPAAGATAADKSKVPSAPTAPRTPQKIPALYVD